MLDLGGEPHNRFSLRPTRHLICNCHLPVFAVCLNLLPMWSLSHRSVTALLRLYGKGRMNGILSFALLLCVTPCPMTNLNAKDEPIKTVLVIPRTDIKGDEPLMVDVFVENTTQQAISRDQFSPLSSSIQLPMFVSVRIPGRDQFSLPPGLYGDDWNSWYQPSSGQQALSTGRFILPAGQRIHLLHGDLRLAVKRAREHCARALRKDSTMERPENAGTKKEYQEIVRFAEQFLRGGVYDVYVEVYSKSNVVRIRIEP